MDPADESSRPEGFYFVVGDRVTGHVGYNWRIWAKRTSFYIKPRSRPVSRQKVSLHGPDPAFEQPGFKLALDGPAVEGAGILVSPGFLPCWFPGMPEEFGLTLAVRICVPWDTFQPGIPNGPAVGDIRTKTMRGLVLRVPPVGSFAILDLYLSDAYPRWPAKRYMRQRNAITHTLRNESGQYLTGITRILPFDVAKMPDLLNENPPIGRGDAVRGVAAAIDPRGFAWLCERPLSRKAMRSDA